MEEIKVGEYVRTKNGIAKIINVEENPHKEKTIYVLDKNIISIEDAKYGIFHLTVNPLAEEMTNKFDTHFGDEKQILKHSKNPIDIIEEGDYVNGDRIDIVEKDENGHTYYMQNCELPSVDLKDIKSIVTHEQFAQIEYKVEE